MKLDESKHPLGTLRGHIKCTPQEALDNWGFVMKPGATGILFRTYTYLDAQNHRRKGVFISNYTPPSNPRTTKQQLNRTVMHDAINHWKLLTDEERKQYNKKALKMQMLGINLHNKEYLLTHHQAP